MQGHLRSPRGRWPPRAEHRDRLTAITCRTETHRPCQPVRWEVASAWAPRPGIREDVRTGPVDYQDYHLVGHGENARRTSAVAAYVIPIIW